MMSTAYLMSNAEREKAFTRTVVGRTSSATKNLVEEGLLDSRTFMAVQELLKY
jgi:hypothetical protein